MRGYPARVDVEVHRNAQSPAFREKFIHCYGRRYAVLGREIAGAFAYFCLHTPEAKRRDFAGSRDVGKVGQFQIQSRHPRPTRRLVVAVGAQFVYPQRKRFGLLIVRFWVANTNHDRLHRAQIGIANYRNFE